MISVQASKGVARRRIVLLGGPGSGKGTAAAWLAKRLEVPHLSTGDMIRAEVSAGTALGREAAGHLAVGRLAPDDLVLRLVAERLRKGNRDGFVFDGFPRTVAQAEGFDRLLRERATLLDRALHLEISQTSVEARIIGRIGCSGCGKVYHATHLPPREPGICDACGGALEKRADDRLDVLRARWRIYNSGGPRLVEFYRRQGKLAEIAADVAPERLYAAVWEACAA